jgi:hypothetical protein
MQSSQIEIDLEAFSKKDQEEILEAATRMEQKQQLESQLLEITSFCFPKCVFKVGKNEVKEQQICLMNCAGRFLDLTNVLVEKSMKTQMAQEEFGERK